MEQPPTPLVPPPVAPPRLEPDGAAIASLVCGCGSLVLFCMWYLAIPAAIAGIICGVLSRTRGAVRTTGIVLSSLGLAVPFLLILGVLGAIFSGAVTLPE